MASSNKKEKQEPINLQEKIIVYATKTNPHTAEGAELRLHPKTAEAVIKRGYATATKPGDKK